MEALIAFSMLGGMAGIAVVAVALMLRQFIYVCRPNEVLVFSGRERQLSDDTKVGYRVVHGGAAFRTPVLEKVDRLDLTVLPIDLSVANAYSRGGIPLTLHAIANVKISSDPATLGNAIERFLGANLDDVKRVAKETLEGHLRGVLARLTPEEVNEDRLKFAAELVTESGEDFRKLGLQLDTLKIQMVSDEVSYLDSIGRERLAEVLSTAEIAESTAKADAEEAQAESTRQGQVAGQQAETMIQQRENDLRRVKAELESLAKSEEERAQQAGLTARARAEQKLQEIRARLENLRLTADVVLPAEAQQRASEMKARAEAASIAADGQALADVLRMMTETWIKAGEDARDIFLLQQLEAVLSAVTTKVRAIQIGEVNLIDGGDGDVLPRHVAAMPATVAAIFRELRDTTGIDVTGILTAQTKHPEAGR